MSADIKNAHIDPRKCSDRHGDRCSRARHRSPLCGRDILSHSVELTNVASESRRLGTAFVKLLLWVRVPPLALIIRSIWHISPMGKTGGGRGSNQYAIKGHSQPDNGVQIPPLDTGQLMRQLDMIGSNEQPIIPPGYENKPAMEINGKPFVIKPPINGAVVASLVRNAAWMTPAAARLLYSHPAHDLRTVLLGRADCPPEIVDKFLTKPPRNANRRMVDFMAMAVADNENCTTQQRTMALQQILTISAEENDISSHVYTAFFHKLCTNRMRETVPAKVLMDCLPYWTDAPGFVWERLIRELKDKPDALVRLINNCPHAPAHLKVIHNI